MSIRQFLLAGGLCVSAPLLAQTPSSAAIDYDKQIAPLLDQYCADCHGADDPDGGFRVDAFAEMIKGGEEGPSIVVGKSAESLLVKFLEGRSGRGGKNEFMPPGKRDKLKPEEIALIKSWIDSGAKGPVVAADQPPKPREVITAKVAPKVTPPRMIQAVAFSDAAKLVAVGRYGEVELLNPLTRAVVRKLAGFKGRVNAVAFSADGKAVFAAGGEPGIAGEVQQWQVVDGKAVRRFEGHLDACYALTLSPDGKVLATGSYGQKIKLWDTTTGKELTTLKGHNGAVYGLGFRPDGKVLASASADRTVKLWSIPDGQRLDTLSQPTKEQNAVVFSRDGKQLFAGGADNRIRIWTISMEAKEGTNALSTARFAHEGGILNLTRSGDGTLLASAATDRSLKIWQTSDLTEKQVLEKQPDWAPGLVFADKNQLVAGRVDGSLAVYDSTNGKPVMAAKPPLPAKLELTQIEPRGLQSGTPSQAVLMGKAFTSAMTPKSSHAALKAELVQDGLKPTQATVRLTAEASLPRGAYDVWLENPEDQESARVKVYVDDLSLLQTRVASFENGPVKVAQLPASLWGTLTATGQHDVFQFPAKAGEELVFDLAVAQVGSMAKSPALEILDAAGNILSVNRGLDSGSDPFIAWKAATEGTYFVRVSNTTMDGSPNHVYRLTVGALPYATGWFPLVAQTGKDSSLKGIGHHLDASATIAFKAGAEGKQQVTLSDSRIRYRSAPSVRVGTLPVEVEKEDNDEVAKAQLVSIPVSVQGQLHRGSSADADCFAFDAKKGQEWIIETVAAQAGSPADTKIEILYPDGKPVPRLLFQAVRDSYNNFRSVDAINPDIRLQNWEEMDLNEYVWFNGDIMRTYRMPRGPDSGFLFYNNNGVRRSYFDTTAAAHSLDEPCYTVIPHPLGTSLVPNGLPVFTLPYANDDEGYRKLGRDSRLQFTVPADGRYVIRVTDTRGWGGERSVYALHIRPPMPDFGVILSGTSTTISPGASMGYSLRADRRDGFNGPITVEVAGVPAGYHISSPLVIEEGYDLVSGSIHAAPDAAKADWSKTTITAKAMIQGKEVVHPLGNFGKITLGGPAKVIIVLEPDVNGKPVMRALADETQPLEITLTPGKTVKAWLRAVRQGDEGLINLDLHGLPHGVIVDDIGLNGVQIREKENERPIFLRAAKWVPEQDRLCHATTASARLEHFSAGLQTSFPILLKIRRNAPNVAVESGR